jgi:CubicO group peptidase (beta-lactamase class C family)
MHAALLAVLLSTVLSANTPTTTQGGATFIAPAGWRVQASEFLTIVSPPEPGSDSGIMLVDMQADDAEMAEAVAWTMYARVFSREDRKIKIKNDLPDKDGWTDIHQIIYITSPNEKRTVSSVTRRAGKQWTVVILDMDDAVLEKRSAQVALITGSLLPKGYTRESFAGKKAHKLDAKRLAALSAFVDNGQKKLGVPGVSVGIVQDGKVVFESGFGVRDLGASAKPDGNTLYMIASNSKALTTLMLAKLVDEKKMTWETPVSTLLPSFKLGTADTTSRVLVKHLICACTGLPRQDYEWLFQYDGVTSAGALQTLSIVQPTSKFGEMYQYSNLLAGAAGFVGGHVLYPDRELGAAYDEAMRTRVFGPLGMTATTFDYARALASPNHAGSHAPDIDGKPAHAAMEANYSIIPLRPAGGAWSSVHDMLKYVQMELDEGTLPGGTRYIGKEPLLARRARRRWR